MNTQTQKTEKPGILDWIQSFVLWIVILFGALVIISSLGRPNILTSFVVLTGSMEPAVKTGSLAFVRSAASYGEGDVVTFRRQAAGESSVPITHRIVEVVQEDGMTAFATKGDANDARDTGLVAQEEILGKVLFTLPFAGYAVSYAKTQIGFVVLIVIPATIIVYSELVTIKDEIRKRMKKRREKRVADNSAESSINTW
jgi:signal peptidase I